MRAVGTQMLANGGSAGYSGRPMIESVDRSRYDADDDARIKEDCPDAQTTRAGSLRRAQPTGDSGLQHVRSLALPARAGEHDSQLGGPREAAASLLVHQPSRAARHQRPAAR